MFQDIKSKPSLREVLPKNKKVKSPPPILPPPSRAPRRRFAILTTLIIIILVVFVAIFVTQIMASAIVTVIPKQVAVPLGETITAYKTTAPAGELRYEVITTQPISQSQTLAASGNETVSRKATGQVIIYNDFSSAAQPLAINTRLETNAGKIYRLTRAVTVPGKGSVEVKVEAASAGPDYNISLSDFTILGFKGTPKYSKIYARSKTAMTGGANDVVPIISPTDKVKALQILQRLLTSQAITVARTQIPDGDILYDDLATVNFIDEELAPNGNNAATLKLTATLTGIVLNKEELSRRLVTNKLGPLANLNFDIANLANLQVGFNNNKLTVNGTADVVMKLDGDALKAELVGQPRGAAQSIFGQFPALGEARVIFRPIWLRHFPTDPERIIIQS
ncbi:MAG: baseplate J/gp47 family protein [Candidatus Vogelbacteria bacterium]|nr:baseplate J/gp47 family protein [Candidatus Vogelbacteria bacterium]